MIKRKYVVLSLLTLVSILLVGFLYSSLVQAQSTVTGVFSVPAAAFVSKHSWDDTRIANSLSHSENYTVYFYGAVQLPNGSIVKEVTSYWNDGGNDDIVCRLRRYDQFQDQIILDISSSGNATLGSTTNGTDAVVNNSQYAYYLEVAIPGESNGHGLYYFHYVTIEYEYQISGEGVGGFWIPVDKLSLLSPYIVLISTIILALSITVAYIKHRKKQ